MQKWRAFSLHALTHLKYRYAKYKTRTGAELTKIYKPFVVYYNSMIFLCYTIKLYHAIYSVRHWIFYGMLLYGSVSQGLETTKFASLIGWNRYRKRSRFSHHCVRSVLTTSVKILPYRPPARLIRAKCKIHMQRFWVVYHGLVHFSFVFFGKLA